MINKSRQMNKFKFKNFDINKRQKKTPQNILPIPYILLCIVLDSVIFSKIKKIDKAHFMVVRYFVVVGYDEDRIWKIMLKFFYTLLKQYLLTSNLLLVYLLLYFLRLQMDNLPIINSTRIICI